MLRENIKNTLGLLRDREKGHLIMCQVYCLVSTAGMVVLFYYVYLLKVVF